MNYKKYVLTGVSGRAEPKKAQKQITVFIFKATLDFDKIKIFIYS